MVTKDEFNELCKTIRKSLYKEILSQKEIAYYCKLFNKTMKNKVNKKDVYKGIREGNEIKLYVTGLRIIKITEYNLEDK